ncbi:MAG TPA: hypothetical protein VGH88_10735 [Streptosporangiaceae bacterium]
MPLQNRVLPTGEIVADAGRGLMMGNRGCLHGQSRQLGTARWRSQLWICCVLDWRGRCRDVMPPGRWTALFFLDEATALAAGHRPCAYCRRGDYTSFTAAWQAARGLARPPLAREMDPVLHGERVGPQRRQVTRAAVARDLPDGVMIRAGGQVGLYLGGSLRPWSWDGYGAPVPVGAGRHVELLTPPSVSAAIAAGYRPLVHPTALAGTAPDGVRAHQPRSSGGEVGVP